VRKVQVKERYTALSVISSINFLEAGLAKLSPVVNPCVTEEFGVYLQIFNFLMMYSTEK
jgi:hypothetical protein